MLRTELGPAWHRELARQYEILAATVREIEAYSHARHSHLDHMTGHRFSRTVMLAAQGALSFTEEIELMLARGRTQRHGHLRPPPLTPEQFQEGLRLERATQILRAGLHHISQFVAPLAYARPARVDAGPVASAVGEMALQARLGAGRVMDNRDDGFSEVATGEDASFWKKVARRLKDLVCGARHG